MHTDRQTQTQTDKQVAHTHTHTHTYTHTHTHHASDTPRLYRSSWPHVSTGLETLDLQDPGPPTHRTIPHSPPMNRNLLSLAPPQATTLQAADLRSYVTASSSIAAFLFTEPAFWNLFLTYWFKPEEIIQACSHTRAHTLQHARTHAHLTVLSQTNAHQEVHSVIPNTHTLRHARTHAYLFLRQTHTNTHTHTHTHTNCAHSHCMDLRSCQFAKCSLHMQMVHAHTRTHTRTHTADRPVRQSRGTHTHTHTCASHTAAHELCSATLNTISCTLQIATGSRCVIDPSGFRGVSDNSHTHVAPAPHHTWPRTSRHTWSRPLSSLTHSRQCETHTGGARACVSQWGLCLSRQDLSPSEQSAH